MADQAVDSLSTTNQVRESTKEMGDYLLWRIPILRLPDSDHPLFNLERKRIKWARTPEQAKKHSQRFLLRFVVFLVVLWLVGLIVLGTNRLVHSTYPQTLQFWQGFCRIAAVDVARYILIGSILLTLLADLIITGSTATFISRKYSKQRTDLLRLTSGEAEILNAEYALAKLRTWRVYLLVLGARLAVLFIGLTIITLFDWLRMGRIDFSDLISGLTERPVDTVAGIIILLLGCIVYVIEPFWRVRALMAGGLLVSTRAQSSTSAIIYGFFTTIIFWVLQILLAIISGYLFLGLLESQVFLPLSNYYYYLTLSEWVYYSDWLFLVFYTAFFFPIVYLFYRMFERVALHQTLKRLG